MLIFTNQLTDAIDRTIAELKPDRTFVLVDTNTAELVLPLLRSQSRVIADATVVTIDAGDESKTLESAQKIWSAMTEGGATRHSLLINVGGGMVTDIGGFAAATFKRGIRAVNVPTTLLGAVDAAVGGKTAVNFHGYKNEIGVFREPAVVIISTVLFNTLPQQQIFSGYAEMLKHGLIDGPATLDSLLAYDPWPIDGTDRLLRLIEESVSVKTRIVEADPTEKGIRKALNLGHTVGHAFESLAMERRSPIAHGYAVAWGTVVELVLSHMQLAFPSETLHRFAAYVREKYGSYYIECDDYPRLLEIMRHDKKNASAAEINFTLLRAPGQVEIDQTASPDDICAALDIYRDLMSI